MTDTSTDQTYLVSVRAHGAGFKTYEVDAPAAAMAVHFARDLAATDAHVPFSRTHAVSVTLKPAAERRCVICGTPADGVFTSWNRCCADPDNIEEA